MMSMSAMTDKVRCVGLLASLWFVLAAVLPGPAVAQQAVLYEVVENLDTVQLQTTGVRTSYWTAQGYAAVGSPFCPAEVVPVGTNYCTITAFGSDSIDTAKLTTDYVVGQIWANVVTVANLDNSVDGAEVAVFSGQITGDVTVLQPNGLPPVVPNLGKKKKTVLGPGLPIIYIVNGKFFPDPYPIVRVQPPATPPTEGHTAAFTSTFRLPFALTSVGTRTKPEVGRTAYYLNDDGSLVTVRAREHAMGFALLRGEVSFTTP